MSGPPRLKSMRSSPEPEARPVLGPAGNKSRSVELRKPIVKLKIDKMQKPQESKGKKSPAGMEKIPSPLGCRNNVGSTLRPDFSMNASHSSDASSTDSSSRSGASTLAPPLKRKVQRGSKGIVKNDGCESQDLVLLDGSTVKKRCAWVTSNADPSYAAFHDEEWGLPLHDDKKLFELLSLSTALAELTWPIILSKRPTFRDVFLDFDPIAVSKLNDKKIATPGSPASSLLSEVKLRAIIENARQICKIIDEFGSFDKYIWGFVNYKPTVGNFRYPRQIPIKTSKAEIISKDLVRRGFRGVGPTVIYSFMQVTGITNDHLINCFRYQDCIIADDLRGKNEEKPPKDLMELKLARDIDDLRLLGS